MRKILIVFITLCIFYFIGGYILVKYDIISEGVFITYASILGGLASVTGLLSFLRPSITKTDIQELEVESLKKISKAAEDLERFKNQRTVAEQEIAKLALQKEEMEFLVKKASLSLFLREQLTTTHNQITKILNQNHDLVALLRKYARTKEKLYALDEEIEKDKNADILNEILRSVEESKQQREDTWEVHGPISMLADAIKRIMFR